MPYRAASLAVLALVVLLPLLPEAAAQELPLEGCTFDATVSGFFNGEFSGRAWIGRPTAGRARDHEELRRLHFCIGDESEVCPERDGSHLFDFSVALPPSGASGDFPVESHVLTARIEDDFRSGLVDEWKAVEGPGTLTLSDFQVTPHVLEHRMEALGTYADTIYSASARGAFQATMQPNWKEIYPNRQMAWMENGQQRSGDPEITLDISFNAGTLTYNTSLDGEVSNLRFVCATAPPFGVIARAPEAGDRNIDFEDAEVEATFSAALDPSTVTPETFEVGYLDPQGNFVAADGEVEVSAGSRVVRFRPQEPLRDAVYYRARLRGGLTGVRGAEGEELTSDLEWRFSTAPDLSGAGPRATSGAAAELHVYQAVRDAPLVTGKPGVLRVYARWSPDPEVHEEEHVEEAVADVSVRAASGSILAADQAFRFVRPDRYEEYGIETADAEHTANRFNWKADASHGSPLTAVIGFESSATGEKRQYEAKRPVEYWPHAPTLDFDYYFLEIGSRFAGEGSWVGGVPVAALSNGHLIARRAEVFATQNFPVRSTRARYGGSIDFPVMEDLEAEGREIKAYIEDYFDIHNPEAMQYESMDKARGSTLKALVNIFMQEVAGQTGAQAVVGFVPSFYHSGGTAHRRLWEEGSPSPAQGFIDLGVRGDIYLTSALTHELGHVLGLEHIPYAANAEAREKECEQAEKQPTLFGGIEGFRIALSGGTGWNKSSEEGNEESKQRLYPLMHPCSQRKTESFVHTESYDYLLANVESMIANGIMTAGSDPRPGAPGRRPLLASLEVGASSYWSGVGLREGQLTGGAVPSGGPPTLASWMMADGRGAMPTERAAASEGVPASSSSDERWLVHGFLGPARDGSRPVVGIAPLRKIAKPSRIALETTGGYEVRLRDADGRVLHASGFTPSETFGESGWQTFQVSVPVHLEARRVEVVQDGVVIGHRSRSEHLPQVRFAEQMQSDPKHSTDGLGSTEGGQSPRRSTWRVRWEGTDEDGDHLFYSLFYSPTGEAPYRAISVGRERTELAIDLAELAPGPQPTLEVVVTDGFDEASDQVRLRAQPHLQVLSKLPSPEDTTSLRPAIQIRLNGVVRSEQAAEAFSLRGPDGQAVDVEVIVEPHGHTAVFIPRQPLRPDVAYEAVLQSGLEGPYGAVLEQAHRWLFRTKDVPAGEGAAVPAATAPATTAPGEGGKASGSMLSEAEGESSSPSPPREDMSRERAQRERAPAGDSEASTTFLRELARSSFVPLTTGSVQIRGAVQKSYEASTESIRLQMICTADSPAMLHFQLPGRPEGSRMVGATARPLVPGESGRYELSSLQLMMPDAPGGGLFYGTGVLEIDEYTATPVPRMRGRLRAERLRSPIGEATVSVQVTLDVPSACEAAE